MPMTRFQGRSAEKAFSKLCSDNGVTCNDSVEDDHGWDHIVEFPHVALPGVSADMQRPIPAVFVQTKSHTAKGLKVTMKLSNAVKLARSDAPAFVVLRTSSDPEVEGVSIWHAVHFWDPLIARVLKRARQASRDGVSEDNFHKHNFSFTMSGADQQTDDELLTWMKKTVLSIGSDYAVAKKALCPPPQIVGTVSFGKLDSIGQLVDHQLGLTPNIQVDSITINQRRFGVDLPFPFPIPSGAITHFTMHSNPVGQCDIWMRGPDGSVVEVIGDIIAPGIPNLPQNQRKFRIRTSMIDIIWSHSGAKFAAHFDPNVKLTPTELEKTMRFFSWSDEGDIDLRVTVSDDPLLSGTGGFGGVEDKKMFTTLVKLAGMLVSISAHLKTKLPRISAADILDSENAFDLYQYIHGVGIELTIKLHEVQPFPETDRAVASGAARVGDWIFAVIHSLPIIRQKQSSGKIVLTFGTSKTLQTYAFLPDDELSLDRLKADFERYSSKKGVLGIWSILSAIEKSDDASL
jgi:hypothetical protein